MTGKFITIAIDAMGGDFGPDVTVPAALNAIAKNPNLRLILVGDEKVLLPKMTANDRISVHHASQQVLMDEAPSHALRSKKDSSMRVAINLVKQGIAEACVSAGNTGALMATAHFVLKNIPGVDRPAIIAALPTMIENKEVWMLDLGANTDATATQLYQFALMASTLAAGRGITNPKIGLLNIGAEEIKGKELVKNAAQLLNASKYINYTGYIEGDGIFNGIVDVVVCDGFTGNVALKTIEGATKLVTFYTKKAFTKNLFTKLAAVIATPTLLGIKKQLDPGRRNGASFIGLQGIVIKSHGGANCSAFENAIREAILEVEHNILASIGEKVSMILQEA